MEALAHVDRRQVCIPSNGSGGVPKLQHRRLSGHANEPRHVMQPDDSIRRRCRRATLYMARSPAMAIRGPLLGLLGLTVRHLITRCATRVQPGLTGRCSARSLQVSHEPVALQRGRLLHSLILRPLPRRPCACHALPCSHRMTTLLRRCPRRLPRATADHGHPVRLCSLSDVRPSRHPVWLACRATCA